MKKINLIEWLSRNSHEKQSPQRFARYAAMLIMLLTLGAGQMWATTVYYVNTNDWSNVNIHTWDGASTNWPGVAMTKTDHKKDGHDIYSYTNETDFSSCLFTCGGDNPDGCKTGNLSPVNNKVYDGSNWNNSFTSSYWDAEYGSRNIYLDISQETGWKSDDGYVGFHMYYSPAGVAEDYKGRYMASHVEGYIYVVTASTIDNAFVRSFKAARWPNNDGDDWNNSNQINANTTKNKLIIPKSGWTGCTLTWGTYVPTVSSVSLSYNVVPSSGSGTAGDPYIVSTGTTVRVTATPTSVISDGACTMKYKWDSGSYGTTAYKDLSCSVAGNTYSTTVTCQNYISSDGGNTASATVYFTAVSDPTITLTSVSPSSSIIAGNDITLVGERANSSNTISFQYTTNDGSTWTDITPKTTSGDSPKTITWTVPDAHGETQTFKFRAKLAEATPKYSDKSSGVSVYNTKTLKVKNTNNWSTMYLHAWNAGGALNGTDWPGKTGVGDNGLSCTNIGGGLWWEVVLTSQVNNFVLHQNVTGNANQTADLAYSSYTDNTCLAISTTNDGDGKKTLPTSTVSCLSAPSVSTSSVTPTVNNKATIGGNVTGLGNDKVTSYGYYYSSTNSSLAGNNLTGATQVEVGTNKTATGEYSKEQTGLTGGTTYYVIAYATNGHSTVYGSRVSFTTPYKVTISNPVTGGTFSSTGAQYVSSTLSVTCTASSGYTFNRWTASGCSMTSTSTTSGVTTATLTPSADNATLTAVYDEDMHTVTVTTDGHGTITTPASGSPRTVSAGIATGASIATSANTGYTFYNWTKTSGSGTVTFTDANTASTTVKATSDATIQANFVDTWNLKGSEWNSWGEYKPMTSTGKANEYSTTLTLTKGTDYSFKVVKRNSIASDSWYGNENNAGDKAFTRGMSAFTTTAEGANNNLKVTPDVTGDYIFTINTSGSTPVITVSYPTAYTVTFGAGTINGSDAAITASATPSFSSGDYVLPETDITFSKGDTKDGYTWKGWYSNVGGTGDAWSTTDASLSLTDTRTSNISVYACYNFVTYNLTYHLNGGSGATDGTFNVETSTITLPTPTRTGYTFDGWYANSDLSTGGVKTQVVKGTHEDQEFWAKWTAKTYTITLKPNGGSGDDQELTATFDAKALNSDGAGNYRFDAITNPEKTGYTFAGWWTSSDAGTTLVTQVITEYKYYDWDATDYIYNSGCWKYDGDVTLYAKWTPNDYAVTLSTSGETGYGSSAPSNQTATFGAGLPTITPPTGAAGYKFMGYFTSVGGAGTKYYNADGTSAKNWDIAEATTLHAHFRKTEISSLEHPEAVATGETVYVVVNPVLNQEGAQPNMKICWSLLYDNDNPVESDWSVESYTEGGTKQNQVRFTLTGMSSGYYKIQAVLYANSSVMSTCDEGTELSTIKSDLRIAGNSTVTIQYEDASGNTIAASTSVEVARGDSIGIKAPSIIGYAFDEWVLGDVISNSCKDDATCDLDEDSINIKAAYDGYLTAKYRKKNMIYFNNTLGWDKVYVYFYLNGAYWAGNDYGTGACINQCFGDACGNKPYAFGEHGLMTQIEGTDIWYFDYEAAGFTHWNGEGSGQDVAFANVDQHTDAAKSDDVSWFKNAKVVSRGDYKTSLSMFVPLAGQTPVHAGGTGINSDYYSTGYWMNYPESTGYTLKIYDNTGGSASLVKERDFAFSADKAMPMSVTVDLEGGNKTYGFKIYRVDNVWLSNGGTMTNGHSGDTGQAIWEFGGESKNCGLTTTSAGNYTFTLSYNTSANHQVGVHYPESTGDFRVMYTDDVRIANHDSNEGKSWLLSSVIPADTEHDTISYFVRAENSKNPKFKIQKCTVSDDPLHPGEEQYRTVGWADQGDEIEVPDSITENGVYNFIFAKNDGNLVLEKIEPYEGNFYIRVDGAGSSNWDNFRAADHLMPYSDYSFKQSENPYSHYFTQWYKVEKVGGDVKVKNIKFVVANDYSVCVSDTIVKDGVADAYVDANGYITRSANIRFMYNHKTNVATRRYVDGAQESGSEFLMILSDDDKMYAASEGGEPLEDLTFTDKGNWVYEAEVYALPTAQYKLRSKFGETATGDANVDWDKKGVIPQYFKGGPSSYATLIGGDDKSDTRVKIRLLYDFKTNRVVAAFQPSSGTIASNMEINADIMFMREHQGDIEQITFAEGKSISKIENIYCCLKFNKYTLNNLNKEAPHGLLPSLLSRYERDIFYVSFPYDVRLSDVIGFGTYGQHWIVEYYDGAARAKNGFWIDSDSYWKFVTPSMKDTFTLKAGTGYIIALDLDEMWYINDTYHADIWNNTAEVELLFPGDVSSISNVDVTYNMPEHTCTINRGTASGNRTIKDSHWNVLGVPTFKNITGQASGDPDEGVGRGEIVFANKAWVKDSLKLKFIYDGNLADNSLTPKAVKDFEFKAMHAYVVQYCGNVTFTTSATPAPASVAARTYAEEPIDVDFRLELNKDGVVEDQTFVSLSNAENASADFRFGEDMSKEFNTNRANIYTFIGTEWVAGNTLPMTNQTTIVPVGVKIAADGEYTFSIPEGTYGVGITLIDNEAGARVNLGLMDYTVTLAAGQIDDRFVLEISPVHQSPTGVELLNGENGENGVRKVLIDNILYIVKDGVVYDAQGKRLQ